MRVATKYPRIAARHLEETGRQAEIVEVKGSVELAPLTGMVEAIVDLTATGTTLRENNLSCARRSSSCTAQADRQPGGAQAQGGRRSTSSLGAAARPARAPARRAEMRDRAPRAPTSVARLGGPDGAARARARARPRGASVSRRRCARSSRAVRAEGDAAVLDYTRRFDTAGEEPRAAASSRREELDEAIRRARPSSSSPGCRWRSRTSRSSPRRASARTSSVELAQGQRILLREVPVALGRRVCARADARRTRARS